MPNFNFIAPIYDKLKKLVFGKRLDHLSLHFLYQIKPSEDVLILGGGTGSILKSIDAKADIDYVELSSSMIKRAKKLGFENVTFHHTDFRYFHSEKTYDWIVCPFFLDVFPAQELPHILEMIEQYLNRDGKLLISDFQITKWWHSHLIRFMYFFFRITAGMRVSHILPMDSLIRKRGFKRLGEQVSMSGLIFSRIYACKGNLH